MRNDREPWRRLASWVLAALVAFAALAALPVSSARAQAAAGRIAVPRQQGAVTDLTGTLGADEDATLREKIATLHDIAGPTLAVLIVPTTGIDSIEQFATRVFDAWKPGTARDDNGLLLLVALNDRRMRIEVGQGLEGQVPDLVANRIIEQQMKPRFREKDYFGGIDSAVDALASLLDGAAPPAADAAVGVIEPPEEPAHGWTVAPGGWVLLSLLAAPLAYGAYRWRTMRRFMAGVAVLGGVLWAVAHVLGADKALWGLLGVVASAIGLTLLAFMLRNMGRSYRLSPRIFCARWVVVIAITILTGVMSDGDAAQVAVVLFFALLFAFLPSTAGGGSGGSDSGSWSSSSSSDSSSSSSSDSSSSSSDSGGSSSGGGSSGDW